MTLLQVVSDGVASTLFDKLTEKFFYRIGIDLVSVFILIRLIYYPIYKHRDLFFTFFIFNLIIFLISFLLNKVELSMGAAFGLFAVFSMLRYRTEDISIKDMTYLFLSIAIGLVMAVVKGSWDDLSFFAAIILILTFLLESRLLMKKESVKLIVFEKIELIQEGKNEELLADLSKRTGYKVHRISIQKIDFLNDSVLIKIYFYD